MGFFVNFCVGYCLEKLDCRKTAKRLKVHFTSVKSSEMRRTSHREILDTFSDGVFEVEVYIATGTGRSPGGDPSFPTIWHRLSDFTGDGIIGEGDNSGPCIVTILKSDRGFESLNSGGWTPLDEHESRQI